MSQAVEIGTHLRVTLVSGVVVEGSVFSLDDQTGQLMLTELHRPNTVGAATYANPNVHVINGQYVRSVEMLPDTAYMQLPPAATKRDSLPVAENGDLKKLMQKLRQETKRRTGLYHENASIDACDTFEFFVRLNPDVKWSTDPEHLRLATKAANDNDVKLVLQLSAGGVLLSGNADEGGHSWCYPKVIPTSKEVSPDLVARLTLQAQACLKRAQESKFYAAPNAASSANKD